MAANSFYALVHSQFPHVMAVNDYLKKGRSLFGLGKRESGG